MDQLSKTAPVSLPLPISDLNLYGLTLLSLGLQNIGLGCLSMESAAQKIAQFLRTNLVDSKGEKALALARVFKSLKISRLAPELQELVNPNGALDPESRCLALLGTDGVEAAWQRRNRSKNHQVIVLDSPSALLKAPMLSELIAQLGIDAKSFTGRGPVVIERREDPELGWFFVPDAAGSGTIPDQEAFVIPYGIKSVIGFGWLPTGGEAYIVILFSRVALPREIASHLRRLASTIAIELLPYEKKKIFTPPDL